jgi:hypothetical protein
MKMHMRWILVTASFLLNVSTFAQERVTDSIPPVSREDSALRITNLNPYMTVHVDSTLNYNLEINRPDSVKYFLVSA